ncbi:PNPOx family protein [Mycolicibacterium bacteremicum]|uniref:Deazaflavin-dependent nitroreductase n=1 Tax=Mycolicibacterium bacteremicum TaxID=564198 RepID=A0A1W9YXE1_MYCBA|nr:hypothetical protein [Mycolicibacterium bacteremicum]MCV7435514.1 hypothetical protein [Mycolicibacterium bacteremicum]ORA04705.1 hypothetical protein BST17_13495 [Mycolicibacterium bacteremicum]
MADQPAVDAAHPPELLLRIVNPTLKFVLRTPLGGLIGDFMLVSFTGRKTGRRYATPVSAHRLDGALYVLLEAQWKHNFRGGADAQVSYRGKTTTMRGELIDDPAAVAALAERIATSYGPKKAQRQMGLTFANDRLPTVAQWESAARDVKLAAIRLS